jgi:opine dehydrogenase
MKIAVLGGGNGAHAAAADLSLRGHEVRMFEFEEFKQNIEQTMKRRGITLMGAAGNGFARVHVVTTDIKEAIEGTDLIMPIMPRFGDERLAELIAPYVEDGQTIILTPGTVGGALFFHKILREEKKIKKRLKIGQCSTLPYACRLVEPALINIKELTRWFGFSAMPSEDTEEAFELFKKLYPAAIPMTNVLEVDLNNGNLILHAPPIVCNAGRIEYVNTQLTGNLYRTAVEFYFREGVTPSVAMVMEGIDRERMAIEKAFGLKVMGESERLYKTGYADKIYPTIYEAFHSAYLSGPTASKGPAGLKTRLLTEDVPYCLTPLASIGETFGIPTSVMKAIIKIASLLNDTDYWKEGRTVEKMGIARMDIPELLQYLKTGERS